MSDAGEPSPASGEPRGASPPTHAAGLAISQTRSPNEPWTPAREAQLRKMFAAGYPFPEIARTLGGVSRNACIAKAGRLGLERGKISAPGAKAPPARKSLAKCQVNLLNILAPVRVKPDQRPLRVAEGAGLNPKMLADMPMRGCCKYPMNDDAPYFFCADPAVGFHVYCPAHEKLVFNGLPPRRKAKAEPRQHWGSGLRV